MSEVGYQSSLSQLTTAVLGRGADFPRLRRGLALDRSMPDTFAIRGRRLVFSYGAGCVLQAGTASRQLAISLWLRGYLNS
jgi:hypothetical protein